MQDRTERCSVAAHSCTTLACTISRLPSTLGACRLYTFQQTHIFTTVGSTGKLMNGVKNLEQRKILPYTISTTSCLFNRLFQRAQSGFKAFISTHIKRSSNSPHMFAIAPYCAERRCQKRGPLYLSSPVCWIESYNNHMFTLFSRNLKAISIT